MATITDDIEPASGVTLEWTTTVSSASKTAWTNPVQFPFVWPNYTACGGDSRFKMWAGSATNADELTMNPWVSRALFSGSIAKPPVCGTRAGTAAPFCLGR